MKTPDRPPPTQKKSGITRTLFAERRACNSGPQGQFESCVLQSVEEFLVGTQETAAVFQESKNGTYTIQNFLFFLNGGGRRENLNYILGMCCRYVRTPVKWILGCGGEIHQAIAAVWTQSRPILED
uniref:Uncharacterized protein n=1 Tax=Micrurus spixii TaxID=129469 RepID=A0A2D4NDW1_9SAUR